MMMAVPTIKRGGAVLVELTLWLQSGEVLTRNGSTSLDMGVWPHF